MIDLNKKIIAIGAHPDDCEIGCGGLLACANNASIMCLSQGEIGGRSRDQELAKAAEILSCKVEAVPFFDDGKMELEILEITSFLDHAIDEIRPDIILTHWPNDNHQDHRAVSQAVISACRNFNGAILFFRLPNNRRFNPNVFFELSDSEWKIKMDAIQAHKSQASRYYMDSAFLKDQFRHWGGEYRSAAGYVEPYELFRAIRPRRTT